MTNTDHDLQDVAELRADRQRLLAAMESGECQCPDEPHQNLLHSLVYDMGTLFTDADYLQPRFQVLKDQESRLRSERDAWKVRAEEAEHLVNLANAQSEADWSHGRRLLEALKGDDDWDWGDVADNAIELAVRAEAAESKLWQHTLANGGCVPKPAYDDLGAVLNAASALKVRWLSRRDEVSAVASDPQIARISATIVETCAEELSAALAGDEVAW